jgi:AcrR family transcriptional regulator
MAKRSETAQRRVLIDATLSSIVNRGLCETSIGSVTNLAGFSRGMVTYWFSSKSALLVAAYQQLLDEWSHDFFSVGGTTPESRIIAMTESMFVPPNFDDRSVCAWIAFSVAALHDDELKAVCHKAYAIWRTAFTEEVRLHNRETGADIDPDDFAASLLALADGLWLRSQVDPADMPPARARSLAVDNIRRLLRPI